MISFNKYFMKVNSLLLAVVMICLMTSVDVNACNYYVSDGNSYSEGYIFIGESHVSAAAVAFTLNSDYDTKKVNDLEDVYFRKTADSSVCVLENGEANTVTMTGNVFFVFNGNRVDEAKLQVKKEYIYSDGKGECGIGVKTIHEVIDANPNIEHWNIISSQGSVELSEGEAVVPYYINSYTNWINYEFPNADIYFMSHSTMTKFYRGVKNVGYFDEQISKAFPTRYLDFTEYYNSVYPAQMKDPKQKSDLIHWNYDVYFKVYSDAIRQIQKNREAIKKNASAVTGKDNKRSAAQIKKTNISKVGTVK